MNRISRPVSAKPAFAFLACVLLLNLGLWQPGFAKSPNKAKAQHNLSESYELSEADKSFIELRDAARKNDVVRSGQLAAALVNYPYTDYIRYFRIKPQMFDKGNEARADTIVDEEVHAFLKTYDGTAIADRLRNDWLLVLGKRKDWPQFDKEYSLFMLDDDTNVKCYALQSQLAKQEDPKRIGEDALKIMIDPRNFGSACQELVPMLVQARGLTIGQAKALGRSAAEMNLETVGKRIGGEDPIAAVVRSARTDASKTYREFLQSNTRFSKEDQAMAWAIIGQFLAKRLDRNAIDAYRRQQQLGFDAFLSTESQEWKVRTALRAHDWQLTKDTIEKMNPAVRQRDPAWTYWYGRAYKELGNSELSNLQFKELEDQYHFYGQLAREELGKPILIPAKVRVSETEIKGMAVRNGFVRGEHFYAMNLRLEGNREWNWELRGMSDKQLLAAAEYAKRINLYDRTVNTADRTKGEHDFSLRYPTPFKEQLSPIAKNIDLNLAWAYGLIRQESRFITNASSSVGASGLMQVMPNTAKYVAKKIGMNSYTNERLKDTQTNLTLGSHYLNMVLQDLDGSWVLASAAYNAGPSRPKSWREKLTQSTEGAIFIESIPFNETRTYVKNVLANATYYSLLMDGKSSTMKQRLGTIQPKTAVLSELP
ncbi:MAG: lytic transglycosylase domain-containing protein [Betaproteobacteria bacterium]|nr:lytic transglycosylase domain-containing protein [Betaproteobacteria bacterium]